MPDELSDKDENVKEPLPIIREENGDRMWFILHNGIEKLHRVGGPAFEGADGGKEYYQLDKLHRVGGPAKILADGTQKYYYNGKLHRSNGPAVIYPDGGYEYWTNGEKGTVWTKNEKTFASKNKALRFLAGPINGLIKKVGEIVK